jgi:hypothetical protein
MTPGEGTDAFGSEPRVDVDTRLDAIEEATEEHLSAIGQAYGKFNRRVSWILRIGLAGAFAAAVVFTYQLGINGDRAKDARKLANQIQVERARNVRDSCVQTNARHNATVTTVDQVLAQAGLTGAKKTADKAQMAKINKALLELADAKGPAETHRAYLEARKLSSPALRKQFDQSRGSTVLLIDALAPVRDCDKLVNSQVGDR